MDHCIVLQNWLKSQFSRKFKHWLWTYQFTNFVFEDAKRSVLNGAMYFFCSFDQNNQFKGNGGSLKISLLQCYEVLWIHNIDLICIPEIPGQINRFSEFFIIPMLWRLYVVKAVKFTNGFSKGLSKFNSSVFAIFDS